MTINVAETVISVPLNKLSLSPLNVRKRPARPEQDQELKTSIFRTGLQQNLVAVPGDGDGAFAVVAGGRRLKMLQELASEDSIAGDYAVRCKIVPLEDGAEHSLIENAVRANMHASEEVTAFRDLILEKDFSRDAVAERYGVTLRVVDQRMKLANVAPEILEAWRDGALTQAQVEAFALSDDPERQRSYFEESADWALKPDSIRKAMLQQALCVGRDRLATFVGREEHEAAGGAVVTDLFLEHVFLQDAALVQELAAKKLQRLCDEAVASEGWAWGKAQPDFSYRDFEKFQRIHGKSAVDPEREALKAKLGAAQAASAARETELTAQCTNPETGEVDQEAFELASEADSELERVSGEIEAANEALQARINDTPLLYASQEKALAGIAVSISSDGRPEFKCGLVHPDQWKQLCELRERARIREKLIAERAGKGRGVAAVSGDDDVVDNSDNTYVGGEDGRDIGEMDGETGEDAEFNSASSLEDQAALDAEVDATLKRQREAAAERERQEAEHAQEMRGDLPASLVSSLTLERTAALRAVIAQRPDLAFRLAVYQFALGICSLPRGHAPVIGIEVRRMGLSGQADTLAGKFYQETVERLCKNLPGDHENLFGHIMAAGDDELFAILAAGVAGAIDAHIPGPQETYRGKKRLADAIARAAELDMSKWWQADEKFFARVPKGVMIEAMREAAPMIRDLPSDKDRELALADLARQPKAELVKIATQALEGAGWLPKPLRTKGMSDGIALDGNGQRAVGNRGGELVDADAFHDADESRDGGDHSDRGERGDEDAAGYAKTSDDPASMRDQAGSQASANPAPIAELPPWMTEEDAAEQGEAIDASSVPGGGASDNGSSGDTDSAADIGTKAAASMEAGDGHGRNASAKPAAKSRTKAKAKPPMKVRAKAKAEKPAARASRKRSHASGAARSL